MTATKLETQFARRLRQFGRWTILVVAVALAWPPQPDKWTSVIVPALSPFVVLGSILATRSVGILTLLALPVLVLAACFPRWFCRYGCPVGLLQETVEKLRPSAGSAAFRFPAIGPWIVLLTLGGACLGYPIFLWLDPLALFNGHLNSWRQPLTLVSFLAGLGLPALLLFDLILPRVWCKRVCPLGATQDLLALPRRLARPFMRCDEAEAAPSSPSCKSNWARRAFLAAGAGAAGAFLLRKVRGQSIPPLRPPGSLDEHRFTGVCIRCGNCVQACPSRIIQPDLGRSGVAGFLTPVLRFDDDYCREDCHRCTLVCPSGAIARLLLEEKRQRIIGLAQVDLDTCLLAAGKECTACIQRCPYEAIVIQSSEEVFSTLPKVDLGRCNGCGACEVVCPVRPHRAIQVAAVRMA